MLYDKLNPNNIDFWNPKQIEKYEKEFKRLLKKENYTEEEKCFITTFLSKKCAHKLGFPITIQNLDLETFTELKWKSNKTEIQKEITYYCKTLGSCQNNQGNTQQNESDYINTFYIDNFVNSRNNRTALIITILHELEHTIQYSKTNLDNHYLDLNSYLTYYNNFILTIDNDFYNKNHDAFYIEKDATIFSIQSTLKLLENYDEVLTQKDKKILQSELDRIIKRDHLKDQLLIAKKIEKIIKETNANFISTFTEFNIYSLEFNYDFSRKTIDQIIELNKLTPKNSEYQNLPIITEELFDYLVYNAIKLDENAQQNIKKLTEEEQEIVKQSLTRTEQNLNHNLETLKQQINYNTTSHQYKKLIEKINDIKHLIHSKIKGNITVSYLKLEENIQKREEKIMKKKLESCFGLDIQYIDPQK